MSHGHETPRVAGEAVHCRLYSEPYSNISDTPNEKYERVGLVSMGFPQGQIIIKVRRC